MEQNFGAINTKIGWIGVQWHAKDGIQRIHIGYSSKAALLVALAVPENARITSLPIEMEQAFQDYAHGKPVQFNALKLDWRGLTDFQCKVLQRCRRIPYGRTMTYAELAREVGSPHAYRAVGSVMARNPYPLVVPCHRVLATNGGLGGFSAPQGVQLKARLLEMENQTHAKSSFMKSGSKRHGKPITSAV
ncbi:MAG TPA: methylated-DNA--[protein]-cysteine S-methyltransferase [Pirellulaceae bacterium]|nr:methylated-DNA--[protein]-cysteine S-methyltransferase [Pirellulaceae bacterium]HMO91930.1 methylated-DNA--[protein]-cysteine S-methyltransferase [Pirellulaceae bacterium]HMP68729.1 methylated-DNA--[protein]-cysteine S-methyltransferase [Pirellulaceae bacterium]